MHFLRSFGIFNAKKEKKKFSHVLIVVGFANALYNEKRRIKVELVSLIPLIFKWTETFRSWVGSTRLSKLFIFNLSLTNCLNYWNICVHLLGYATNSIVILIQFWFADFRYCISTGWDHQSCAVPTTSSWGQTCCTTHAYQVIVLTLQWYSLNLEKMVEEFCITLFLWMSLEITDGFFCI